MSAPAVALHGVSKRFTLYHQGGSGLKERLVGLVGGRREARETFWALRDVGFSVDRGETLGLIGHNGCGKSTLLQIIAGILEPDEGRVETSGRITSLLELGAGFSPDLSGRENIFLNASLHGVASSVIRAKFDEIVAFAELGRFIDTPVRNYSSGMYMRLGFSVAAHLDPEIVLVDEALAVGDESFQRKCLRKIQQFQAQGVTVIIVSHDLLLVERLCTRACLLQRGELLAMGPAADVISRYHQIAAASGEVAGEYRWGSREVEIPQVRLLDAADQPVTSLQTGEALTIAFSYRAARRVPRPVFGLAVYHEDGTHLTGPNTRTGGLVIPEVEGDGEVRYSIDHLPLLPGRYVVSVSAYDYHLVEPLDHRERVATFTVTEGGTLERFGKVTLGGTWRLVPAPAREPVGP
ncbi:ABC transporter [Luteitalea sp. TBR-22]|uniref:ABC transporter ATP-binding protein n=1 Tax=Luteitalea sp. TBR-22 TaxID=2802971 RepID=UPI001AF71A4A|nr:ABC transporter ATP-binding protein [Luteitalea sp. TBR-22]BCS34728.1 ABC transporter [Luteitalea sp. TBR-22]